MNLSGKFEPTIGASKTRLYKKLGKCELDNIARNSEEWIAKLELLKGDLLNMDLNVDD